MRKLLFSTLVIFFTFCSTSAQVPSTSPYNAVVPAVFNNAGATYDNALSYYRFEWSFGELTLTRALAPSDSSILVTHGVLQPCTDIIGSSPQALLFEKGDYKLFPNPTSGKFEVNFFIRESGQMALQLINSLGQLLEKRSFHYDGCCRIELFDLAPYPNGVYFIVADLKPDMPRSDGIEVIRHSGLRVIRLNEN